MTMTTQFWKNPLQIRIAQRMFRLFLLCAVLPIVIIALVADRHVAGYLESKIERDLRRSGRVFAASLADLLLLYETGLRQFSADDPEAVEARLTGGTGLSGGSTIADLDLFRGLGMVHQGEVCSVGESVDLSELTPGDYAFVGAGHTLLKAMGRQSGGLRLVMFQQSGDALFYGLLSVERIQSRLDEEGSWGQVGMAVYTDDRQLVFRTPGQALPPAPFLKRNTLGRFDVECELAGQAYIGVISSLFLKARFGTANWLVLLIEPREAAYLPVVHFRKTFVILMLLTIATVSLFAIVRIRSQTGHIKALCDAAGRIADRDFGHRIDIRSGDEFESLANAFNGMSESLHKYQVDLSEKANALRESEQRYRALLNLGPDGIVLLCDGRCVFVNSVFTDMFGYSQDDFDKGLTFVDLLEDRAKILLQSEENGGKRSAKQSCVTGMPAKDGSSVPVDISMLSTQHDGRPAWLVSVRDITERKRAEEERREMEEQLRHAEKLGLVGQFAGRVAHDFNNQLTSIMGFASLLASELEDEKHRGRAALIVEASKRSRALTSQLLAFSRKAKYQSVPVNVHELITEVVSLFAPGLPPNVRIRQCLNADPPTTKGDPTHLHGALLNLAVNARDAMRDGGEIVFATDIVRLDEIFCRRHPDTTAGEYLHVSVTDTGSGMDMETQRHIFEPFFTTKEEGKGTGLGLASVYGTVKSHGGAVDFHSEVGHGTTFNIYLPIAGDKKTGGPRTAAKATHSTKTARILVVDDDETIRALATEMLADFGYKVTTSQDGMVAVEYYREMWQNIGLVVLDMDMPRMGGADAFAAMQEINPEVKAILMSGHGVGEQVQRTLARGALAFVPKPFLKAELSSTIAAALG